jgi:sugar transferase (PEP-CTERM/EpsH1 system associated)
MQRDHSLTLATLWETQEEHWGLEKLAREGVRVVAAPLSKSRAVLNVLAALPNKAPLQAAYCWQPALAQKLDTLISPKNSKLAFDVVHVEHLRGAQYGLRIRRWWAGHNRQPPIVWDSVDCISLLFRRAAKESKSPFGRWVTRFELGRTERYEGWLAQQFDHVLLTSPADKEALAALLPSDRPPATLSVLGNGVDLDYFKPADDMTREQATVVITGKMSYHANITMTRFLVEEIMPHVWASRPDVKVIIVGKDPAREVMTLAQNPAVTVTGTVADIRPYLQRATLAVAPVTYGVGIQNKVLEAMACATPVVATPQVVTALTAVAGRDLLVAQEPVEFAKAVLALLQDDTQRGAVGRAGRAYVESHHDWAAITVRLEHIYCRFMNQSRQSRR